MINVLFSRICVLTFGTLYPGYASFKAVRAKSVEDYVKWMMFWIVFAIFTAGETFTDIFLAWFPFYYEMKVLLILWLLPTIGNGSSFIYKKCIHPLLKKHERRVDNHLEQVREKGQDLILHYMSEAVFYIGRTVMNVVNKKFPNGIMGAMTSSVANERRLAVLNNIVIEEYEEEPQIAIKVIRKNSIKTAAKNSYNGESHTARGRGRKARQTKSNSNHNLNESQ